MMKGKDIRCVRYTVLTISAGKTPFSDWYAPLLHCRKPGVTGRGLYELKPEYLKEYNPFFYHYTRIDQSKVCTFVSNFERVSGKCNKTKIRATAKNTKKSMRTRSKYTVTVFRAQPNMGKHRAKLTKTN